MADGDLNAMHEGKKTSDLMQRSLSAVVLLLVAGACLWAGGLLLDLLVVLVAGVAYWEWQRLVRRMSALRGVASPSLIWMLGGAAYIGGAACAMIAMPAMLVAFAILVTVFVDSFAYFAGRSIGGPKIAPAISPSKTWAGLGGGIVGATLALALFFLFVHLKFLPPEMDQTGPSHDSEFRTLGTAALVVLGIVAGAILAIVAQAGDFFESWLKRRAGVKDSSAIIPGHGGVLDRVDGMLPVAIVIGLLSGVVA